MIVTVTVTVTVMTVTVRNLLPDHRLNLYGGARLVVWDAVPKQVSSERLPRDGPEGRKKHPGGRVVQASINLYLDGQELLFAGKALALLQIVLVCWSSERIFSQWRRDMFFPPQIGQALPRIQCQRGLRAQQFVSLIFSKTWMWR